MAVLGYARVSTGPAVADRQHDALTSAGPRRPDHPDRRLCPRRESVRNEVYLPRQGLRLHDAAPLPTCTGRRLAPERLARPGDQLVGGVDGALVGWCGPGAVIRVAVIVLPLAGPLTRTVLPTGNCAVVFGACLVPNTV